jgi:hypothetical protein
MQSSLTGAALTSGTSTAKMAKVERHTVIVELHTIEVKAADLEAV